jgi:hypothetical protein
MHFEFGFLGKQNILAIVVHITIYNLSLSLSLSLYIYRHTHMEKLHLTNTKEVGLISWWSHA